jgi:hypothetical protein
MTRKKAEAACHGSPTTSIPEKISSSHARALACRAAPVLYE